MLKIGIEDDIKHFSINDDGSTILTLSDVDKDGNQIVKLSELQNNRINQMMVKFKVTDIDWVYFSDDYTKIITNFRNKKIEIQHFAELTGTIAAMNEVVP